MQRATRCFQASTSSAPQVKPGAALAPSPLKESDKIEDVPLHRQYCRISAKAKQFHLKTRTGRDASIGGAPLQAICVIIRRGYVWKYWTSPAFHTHTHTPPPAPGRPHVPTSGPREQKRPRYAAPINNGKSKCPAEAAPYCSASGETAENSVPMRPGTVGLITHQF